MIYKSPKSQKKIL